MLACQQKMADQPRYEPLQKSNFFDDQRASRPLVEGTVARGHLNADEQLYTGKADGEPAKTFPFPHRSPGAAARRGAFQYLLRALS